MRLQRLNRAARRLVTPEFVRGEDEHARLEVEAWEPYAEAAASARSLERFREATDQIIATTEPFSTTIDARVAIAFHQSLPLTLREAADPGIWRFLAVVVRPEFVRHRWENPTFSVARSRFWSPGTRPDSNAIARLWWIAELTRDGDDYGLTKRTLRSQAIANAIFIRSFCEHRPAIEACVEWFGEMNRDEIEEGARNLHHALSTRVLPTLEKADIQSLLGTSKGPEGR
jgi:hypothetical protein